MFEISTTVGEINKAFYYIFAVSGFFIVAITIAMIYFVIRYNHRRNPRATDISGSLPLEVLWTVVPTILALGMFYYGWMGFMTTRSTPVGAVVIDATARKYNWTFEYENGKQAPEIRVPVNVPVELRLNSADVIHSFYLPAFRVKEDLVPGQQNYTTFTPLQTGVFDIFCAEYCGVGHSAMNTRLMVLEPETFDQWYKGREAQEPLDMDLMIAGNDAMIDRGKTVYETQCYSCHGGAGQGGLVANARNFTSLEGWVNGAGIVDIFRTVTNGLNEEMPAFPHIAADDRFAVGHYVQTFARGHDEPTAEEIAALDEEYSLSAGSDAPPEIPISEAMRILAVDGGGEATGGP